MTGDCQGHQGRGHHPRGAACREQGYLPEALHFLGKAEELWDDLADSAAVAHVR
ncbi:hypothetical protein ITP53_11625 [Nonomuraea sp. K274]|uniref:Uncharacterized protein n=1 Tax=Nonomuraea cypriaca TaxID=1187855 RepID=A0A931AAI3_9ACTN|nr:hypothetical protein [Nonomuraea cypriaca]MBF8186385.1 hypothetical protein [Nonomuraea cypriaca]